MTGELEISVLENCLIRTIGPLDKPLLLCVAGYADNGTMFLPLFESWLTDKYRLATVDLPGTGSSPAKHNIQTIEEYANCLTKITAQLSDKPAGLIGHSIASAICVKATHKKKTAGLFSIEGNLTTADSYFTGRAAKYETHQEFWTAQRMHIKSIGYDDPVIQRYYAAATFADPSSMWRLGLDAVRLSENDRLGKEFPARKLQNTLLLVIE